MTFIAATNYLNAVNQPFENYATAFLAVMESPAIYAMIAFESDVRVLRQDKF